MHASSVKGCLNVTVSGWSTFCWPKCPIGGCLRSGTTLLGSMLGAGPGCVPTPESPFKIHPLAARLRGQRRQLTQADVQAVLDDWFLASWDIRVAAEELASQ